MVAPDYFSVMSLAVIRGQVFRLGEPSLVVVSESAARVLWPKQNPVGKIWNLQGVARTVAGVVRDSGGNLFADPDSIEAYIPIQDGAEKRMILIVHTSGDPALLASSIAQATAVMNQHVAVSLMKESRHALLEMDRKLITLIGSLAVVATLLAAAGMFALVAFVVAQRKRELGIRIAIGARPRHILWALLAENLKPTAAGLVAGILMAAGLLSLVRGTVVLRSNEAGDIAGFTAGVACFVLIAALATLSPAFRALRIDPSETLREE
jgi:ABC-type antimicrobial peptide transport system permease subunit